MGHSSYKLNAHSQYKREQNPIIINKIFNIHLIQRFDYQHFLFRT